MPIGSRSARAGRHSKHPRIRRITPEQFRETREFTGKSREDVAQFLGVSLRTVGHWETGKARVPYAAYRLLRVALRGDMLDPAWQGYRIARGRLVTPEGYAFGPGDLAWLSLLVARAGFQSLAAIAANAREQAAPKALALGLVLSETSDKKGAQTQQKCASQTGPDGVDFPVLEGDPGRKLGKPSSEASSVAPCDSGRESRRARSRRRVQLGVAA
jgi:DNA-binding transcriptional regulator YiaG